MNQRIEPVAEPLLALATGRAHFTSDIPLPAGTLHGATCYSPHAHASVIAVDPRPALDHPGVRAVLLAADIPGANDISNLSDDEPLLADGAVHHVGQTVALVLANTAEQAWQAARAVAVTYDILPAVLDARTAAARGLLIAPPRTFAMGDVDSAWQRCTTIVSGTAHTGAAEHLYLEAQCALAIPRDDGGLVVHSATQAPSTVQKAVARVLGRPMHDVEVTVTRLGGGFGGKEDQATLWAALAALGAQATGRAVRLWPDRHDDMVITGKRHPYDADFRLGLDADGKFLAYEADLYQNAGACADLSLPVLERSLFHATGSYLIPNTRVTAYSARTNLPPNTAFRGFGAPQGMFVIESAIQAAAQELGIHAEELQRRNLLAAEDPLPYGQPARNAHAIECWESAASAYDLAGLRAQTSAHNAANPWHPRGLAVQPVCFGIAFTATLLNQAEALVHVYLDGSVGVTTGAVEMGQGVATKIRRVVATTLGVPVASVRMEATSTTRVANVSPTAASTGADLNGEAARRAAAQIRASMDEVSDPALPWEQRVADTYAARRTLSALVHYATPDLHFDRYTNTGQPFAYHVYGTAIVQASVDILRGVGRIDRVQIVHDGGTSIDPNIDHGQIAGGLVQGIGWMTTEEIRHDPTGRLLTDSLANYKIPDLDSAPELEIRMLQDIDPSTANPGTVMGSKAVGEPPLVYGLGAFFALREAVSAFRGERPLPHHFAAPMTNEVLFDLIHQVGDQ